MGCCGGPAAGYGADCVASCPGGKYFLLALDNCDTSVHATDKTANPITTNFCKTTIISRFTLRVYYILFISYHFSI